MGKGILFVCLLAAVACTGASSSVAVASTGGGTGAAAMSASSSAAPVIVRANTVKWTPIPGIAGAEAGVLWGDPKKSGSQYAERLKLADGTKFAPHTHPQIEQVTVLSGVLLVGVGKTVDPSKMVALPAGSFVAIPANLPHYGMAKGETILEIHGIGPDVMNMVK